MQMQCWRIVISYFFTIFILSIFGGCVGNQTFLSLSVYLDTPDHGETIKEDELRVFQVNYSVISGLSSNPNSSLLFTICAAAEDEDVADIYLSGDRSKPKMFDLQKQPLRQFNYSVRGIFMGRTNILFSYVFSHSTNNVTCDEKESLRYGTHSENHFNLTVSTSDADSPVQFSSRHQMVVVREDTPMDIAFNVVVVLLVLVVNLGMGCETKLNVIKETLRKPVAPVVGFSSQFIIMPLISFGTVKLFKFNPAMAIGFFALGCSPGGSASNAYTWLLDGDLSLSITMTLISTLAALGMIPLWMFTLGQLLYSNDSHITVPYQNIMFSLFGLIIPVSIGLFVQHKRPHWAKVLVKISKGMMGIFIIFVFTFGVYTKLYIFRLMTPTVILTGALMPYLGFTLGGLVALACRMPRYQILTIAIETGIQNTGIAIMMLLLSLDHPDSDLSITAPIISSILTPFPLLIAIAVKYLRQRFFKKHKLVLPEGGGDADHDTAVVVKTDDVTKDINIVFRKDAARHDHKTNDETDHERNDEDALLCLGQG